MNTYNDQSKISVSIKEKMFADKKVISNLKFEVFEGEFVSIVGPFGAGKSTLLKILAGLIEDYTGDVNIFQKTIQEVKKEHKIGICFQKPTLLPWLNVIDNITFPLKITGNRDIKKGKTLLQIVGLSMYEKSNVSTLSGGTQQLISLLRSLILDPYLLILDEPLSSIDEINRINLQNEILRIHKLTKKTTIMVTHSVEEAIFLSDKVIILSNRPTRVKKIVEISINRDDKDIRYKPSFQRLIHSIREDLK